MQTIQQAISALDAILLNAPFGICFLEGPSFRYFRINKALAEINGIAVSEHIGRPLAEVIPDADLAILPRLRRVQRTGTSSVRHEFSMHLGGSLRYFVDTFFPVVVDGQVWAVGAIVEEITELRKAEEDLALSEARRLVERLTPREFEVFALVASGKLNKEIAVLLGIAVRTVKAHRAEVMKKMKTDSPVILGRLAERLGDIKP